MIGEKIKKLRKSRDMTQQQLAELVDSSSGYISEIENGKKIPGGEMLISLKRVFDVSIDWMLNDTEDDHTQQIQISNSNHDKAKKIVDISYNTVFCDGFVSVPKSTPPDPETYDYIPMAKTKLSAGHGAFVLTEDIGNYYAFRKTWVKHNATSKNNLVLMQVTGDSMNPTLQHGDAVMIDVGRRSIKEGMIFALRMDDTVMVKRLVLRPNGTVLVVSDNKQEYDPYEAKKTELHVLGQIIFFCRTFNVD